MALRFLSRRPLSERREILRRRYRFVCWLISVLTLAIAVGVGSGSLPEESHTVLQWCFIVLYFQWLAMSIVLVIWTAVLWARGGRAPRPTGPPAWPEPSDPRQGGDLIDRLCRDAGWVVTGREVDRYEVRSADHRKNVYIELRYDERHPNIVFQSWFGIRFSMERPPSGLFARVLLRGTSLCWASWRLHLGQSCEACLAVSASLPRSAMNAGLFRDVCEEMGLPCISWDIHQGHDACDPHDVPPPESFAFIWAHPPYWRQKLYADDPRDLSRAATLEDFLRRYGQFIKNCRTALKRGGKLAILMGDYCDREAGFVPLVYHTKRLAFAAGLVQRCTDIIRFSHGASSGKKVYRSSFIPGLHDVCTIFEKVG